MLAASKTLAITLGIGSLGWVGIAFLQVVMVMLKEETTYSLPIAVFYLPLLFLIIISFWTYKTIVSSSIKKVFLYAGFLILINLVSFFVFQTIFNDLVPDLIYDDWGGVE